MTRTCPHCNNPYNYDPTGPARYRYICPDCHRERQRAYMRKSAGKKRRENSSKQAARVPISPTGAILEVIGYKDATIPPEVEIWQEWRAPMDHVTRLMLRAGDFPPGLLVRVDGAKMIVQRTRAGRNYLEVMA